MSLTINSKNIKLPFMPPVLEGDALKVDQVDFAAVDKSETPFKASRFEVYPGKQTPVDQHEVVECWFVAKGTGKLKCDDEKITIIEAGDVMYFNPYQSHMVQNTGEDNLVIYSIWWKKK